ncbi:MAG: TlpA disulfide reductase family protein [Pseudomonadota bacterium]|nr:TlpA disulfide reductase family protein [Pseudomonadota bacterium]
MLLLLAACIPDLTSPPGSEEVKGEDWVAPENSWGLCKEPPASLVGEGLGVGEVAPDFRLADQHGAEVSLWQFHGCTVVLDFSTGWCGPCQDLAEEAQSIADEYRDQDVRYVTVMPQNVEGDVPDQDFLVEWGEDFGLFEPILLDDEGYTYELVVPGSDRGFPAVLVIDAEGVVAADISEISDTTIRAAIEDEL